MKRLVGTAILCVLAAAPVYALQQPDNRQPDDKQQEAPKAPDRAQRPADKPAEKPVDKPAKPSKEAPVRSESAPRHQDDQQAQQQQKTDERAQKNQEKAQQNEQKTQQKQAKNQQKQEQQQTEQQRQAANRSHDQNRDQGHSQLANNAPRGQAGDRRIPEDRYRANFGRDHTFHIRRDNDRRFDFGGFAFEYDAGWPSAWSYDDDFYIVEIDGVDYLCDARYPDQRIVVVVVS
jgi:hypothetical protein